MKKEKNKKIQLIIKIVFILLILSFIGFVIYKSINGVKTGICFIFCSKDTTNMIYGWEVVKYYLVLLIAICVPIVILISCGYFIYDIFNTYKINKLNKKKKHKPTIVFNILLTLAYLVMLGISLFFLKFLIDII